MHYKTGVYRKFLFFSGGLFILSCFLPVTLGGNGSGWSALLFGWMTIAFDLRLFIPWLANIFYLLALFPKQFGRELVITFASGAIVSALTILWVKHTGWSRSADHDFSPGPACYVWIASFVVLLCAHLFKEKDRVG